MRLIRRYAMVFSISVVVFAVMQSLFGGSHSADFGEKHGFPSSYMRDAAFVGKGHLLWPGFLGDFAIPIAVTALAVWLWPGRKGSK